MSIQTGVWPSCHSENPSGDSDLELETVAWCGYRQGQVRCLQKPSSRAPSELSFGHCWLVPDSLLLAWAGKVNEGGAKVLHMAKTVGLLLNWGAQVLSRTEFVSPGVETHP